MIFPLFKTTYLDIKRGRAYQVLLLFAFFIISSSTVFTFFTAEEEMKLIKDIGLMSINMFGVIFVLFGLSRRIPDEIEDKTIYTILTNPVDRMQMLLADLLAYLYVLLIGFFIMTVVFYSVLYLKQGLFDILMLKGVIVIYMKMIIFSVIVLFFSTFLSPLVNIALSLFLYFGGHLTNYISSAADQKNFLWWCFLKAIYTILPNFENYNCSDALTLGTDVSWKYICLAGIYSLLYGVSLFLLAGLVFKKREI